MTILKALVLGAAVCSLAVPALASSFVPAGTVQQIDDSELLRFVYNRPFPQSCYQAQEAAAKLRVKPASDPGTMHNMMRVYYDCAHGPYGQKDAALFNNAMFGFAAAALLAARHEGPPLQLKDANYAREVSANLVNYYKQPGAGAPLVGNNSDTPSMLRTNADRIHTDAKALIAALQAAGPASNAGGAATPAPASTHM